MSRAEATARYILDVAAERTATEYELIEQDFEAGWDAAIRAMEAVAVSCEKAPGSSSEHEWANAIRWALEEVEHEQAAEPIVTLSRTDAELIRKVAQHGLWIWPEVAKRAPALEALLRLGQAIGDVKHGCS